MEIYKCILYVWRGKRNRTQRRTKIPQAISSLDFLPTRFSCWFRKAQKKEKEAELTYKKERKKMADKEGRVGWKNPCRVRIFFLHASTTPASLVWLNEWMTDSDSAETMLLICWKENGVKSERKETTEPLHTHLEKKKKRSYTQSGQTNADDLC